MRDPRERTALFLAIAAYLDDHRRPRSSSTTTRCAACGCRIAAGEGRIDPALLYYARRCARCYALLGPEPQP